MIRTLPLLLLTACATRGGLVECPTTPVPVEIERRVFVAVPAQYSTPLPIEMSRDRTVRELRRVARERRAQLELANDHRAELRLLAPEDPQ